MKLHRVSDFVKTTLLGGLIVILPVLLLSLLLLELHGLVIALAQPISALLPFEHNLDLILALVLLVAASFIFGLVLRSTLLSRLWRQLEAMTLGHLPLYRSVKRLGQGLLVTNESTYQTAVFTHPNGIKQLVYVIEQTDSGCTVLVPHAPSGFTGYVYFVPTEQLVILEENIGTVSASFAQWGLGTAAFINQAGASPREGKSDQ